MLQPIQALDLVLLFAVVLVSSYFLASYIVRIYTRKPSRLDSFFSPIENIIYRVSGVDQDRTMGWKEYFLSALLLNIVQMLIAFIILVFQSRLPLNPQHFSGLSWDLAFNTVVSFATNTNLQHYAGEMTLSYFSQMTAIQFLQFTSAATGISCGVAMVRGLVTNSKGLGNFYVDFVRSLTRLYFPLCFVHLGVFRRTPNPRRIFNCQNRRGRYAVCPCWARRVSRFNNAARNERRRILWCKLRLSISESNSDHELGRDLPYASHSNGSHLCVWTNDRKERRKHSSRGRSLFAFCN